MVFAQAHARHPLRLEKEAEDQAGCRLLLGGETETEAQKETEKKVTEMERQYKKEEEKEKETETERRVASARSYGGRWLRRAEAPGCGF